MNNCTSLQSEDNITEDINMNLNISLQFYRNPEYFTQFSFGSLLVYKYHDNTVYDILYNSKQLAYCIKRSWVVITDIIGRGISFRLRIKLQMVDE